MMMLFNRPVPALATLVGALAAPTIVKENWPAALVTPRTMLESQSITVLNPVGGAAASAALTNGQRLMSQAFWKLISVTAPEIGLLAKSRTVIVARPKASALAPPCS